jgi:hypothetical protein
MFGEILKAGDRVVIDIPDENWQWGYRPVPKQHGCVGVVTGFGEMEVHRIHYFGIEPGVYVDKNDVALDVDGLKVNINAHNLRLEDKKEEKSRLDGFKLLEFRNSFWEYDIVSVKPEKIEHLLGIIKGREMYVSYIRYPAMEQKKYDGSPMPIYDVAFSDIKGMLTSMDEADMTLVKRGNVWKYYHNEPLEFENLVEEIDFFHKMGHYKEVQNPKTGTYSWELMDVLEAVKRGDVDCIKMAGSVNSVFAFKMNDRELGERVRKATLSGFQ